LNITDTMPAGWKFGSAGAPWACQQSGNAFTCTHPQTTLATNQSITLKVDLVPSAPTGSQPAEVENCAEIDWKGGAGDLNKNNDHRCWTPGPANHQIRAGELQAQRSVHLHNQY
jgi:hypothetical protein